MVGYGSKLARPTTVPNIICEDKRYEKGLLKNKPCAEFKVPVIDLLL